MSARVLVVDDEPIERELLVLSLESEGFDVTQAAAGPEALARLEVAPFDLVLLDVQMPAMSGLEVLGRIRGTPALRGMPVLLVSSLDLADVKALGIALGADDYITKPCPRDELIARARAGLRGHPPGSRPSRPSRPSRGG